MKKKSSFSSLPSSRMSLYFTAFILLSILTSLTGKHQGCVPADVGCLASTPQSIYS